MEQFNDKFAIRVTHRVDSKLHKHIHPHVVYGHFIEGDDQNFFFKSVENNKVQDTGFYRKTKLNKLYKDNTSDHNLMFFDTLEEATSVCESLKEELSNINI